MTDVVQIVGGISGVISDVDADKRLLACARSPAFGLGSARRVTGSSTLTTQYTLVRPFAMFLWLSPAAVALVQSVKIAATVATTITTAVQCDFQVNMMRNMARGAVPTSGTLTDLSGAGNPHPMTAMRSSHGASRTAIDINPATGSLNYVFAMTGGANQISTPNIRQTDSTSGLTETAVGYIQGFSGTAVGTSFFPAYGLAPLVSRDAPDTHPLVLAQYDALVIRNVQSTPASGSWELTVQFEWIETTAYN